MELPDPKLLQFWQEEAARLKRLAASDTMRDDVIDFMHEVSGLVIVSDAVQDEDNIAEIQRAFAARCEEYDPPIVYEALRVTLAKLLRNVHDGDEGD